MVDPLSFRDVFDEQIAHYRYTADVQTVSLVVVTANMPSTRRHYSRLHGGVQISRMIQQYSDSRCLGQWLQAMIALFRKQHG